MLKAVLAVIIQTKGAAEDENNSISLTICSWERWQRKEGARPHRAESAWLRAAPPAGRDLPAPTPTFQAIHEQPLQALVNADLDGAVGRLSQQRRGNPEWGNK